MERGARAQITDHLMVTWREAAHTIGARDYHLTDLHSVIGGVVCSRAPANCLQLLALTTVLRTGHGRSAEPSLFAAL